MKEKKISIGRIVRYRTTEAERLTFKELQCNEAKELPAIIVAHWGGTTVNLKVFVDGRVQDLWKTSVTEGDQPGNWSWPEDADKANEAASQKEKAKE